MAYGLVIIEKEHLGETWSNTHAFDTGGTPGLGDDDLIAIGMDLIVTGLELYLGGVGYDAAVAKLLSALIAFERKMHFQAINFTKLYVTDGKINTPLDPNSFAVATLAFTGQRAAGDPDAIMPGNVTFQVNRVPAGFSARQGRMYMRGVLGDADVRFAGRGGVAWTSAAANVSYNSVLQGAVTESGLNRYFGAGVDGVQYCIPQYAREAIPEVQRIGQLNGVTPIGGLVGLGPASRQMKRGRKRAAA